MASTSDSSSEAQYSRLQGKDFIISACSPAVVGPVPALSLCLQGPAQRRGDLTASSCDGFLSPTRQAACPIQRWAMTSGPRSKTVWRTIIDNDLNICHGCICRCRSRVLKTHHFARHFDQKPKMSRFHLILNWSS